MTSRRRIATRAWAMGARLALHAAVLFGAENAVGQVIVGGATTSASDHIARGKRAAATGQWTEAVQEYERANQLEPSPLAAEGVAKARDALHDDVKAYLAFNAMLRDYPQGLSPNLRRYAQTRIQALARVTGTLTVKINEAGARVVLDGQDIGTSPLPVPVRVTPGGHRLRVSKPGFVEGAAQPTALAAADVPIPISLVPEPRTGHVSVQERTGQPLLVLIDGVVRGRTPWQGEVEAGQHEVAGQGDDLVARAQPIAVTKGLRTEVELVAMPVLTHVNVAIAERRGSVYVDGHVVGEGSFEGDLPVGPHSIRLTREGHEQFDKDVMLVAGKPYVETVSLAPITVVRGDVGGSAMHGGYGGLILHGTFEPDGVHGDLTPPCSFQVGACTASSPVGGGLLGYAGFAAGMIGIDALFGIQADSGSSTVTPSNAQALNFTLARGGGLAAVRARLAWQTSEVRFTLAAGVGAAVRIVRVVQNGSVVDLLTGSSQETTYAAPGVTLDAAVHWRVTPGTAASMGFLFWGESAGSGVLLQASPLSGTMRAYSGTQAFFMPFLGLEFGP